jgi:hypothetical protein
MSDIPKVGENDALRLENALLRVENVQLHLNAQRDAFNALAGSLAVEGYAVQRMTDGAWVYQPVPPKEAK